ncbi:MAG: hypothetical protein J1E56_05745 [Ruminococcus sp.]|nr:hypothetical protein [Ruminococcus sp.]
MNIVGICIITIFAIWGLAEFIRSVVMLICKKTSPKEFSILIIPIKENCEEAEYILRSAAQQIRFSKKNIVRKVVCVMDKPDIQTEKICTAVCKEYPFMEIAHLNELKYILRKNYGLQ